MVNGLPGGRGDEVALDPPGGRDGGGAAAAAAPSAPTASSAYDLSTETPETEQQPPVTG